MSKRDESGVRLKDIKGYNEKYHFNHGKPWTCSEVDYILSTDHSLVFMSLSLGRSASAIVMMRYLQKNN